ncbi:GTP cyclohydrolase II [Steroidobacter cummioxidans]|uniref:GTP cyclohydrolase II n=1 Tax=Steroidobacter cummioxidans TaxID=1803913 RepID=UPI000E30E8D2|nr:GTP cyclohydrolase II [Steroidobacter cummioxidans]
MEATLPGTPILLQRRFKVQEINGDPALVAIERAIHELRCGRALYCCETDDSGAVRRGMLVAAAETVSTTLLARLEQVAGKAGLALAITRERAETLGFSASAADGVDHDAVLLRTHQLTSASVVGWLAGVHPSNSGLIASDRRFAVEPCDTLIADVLQLAKSARLLPAALIIPLPTAPQEVLTITKAQLERLVPSASSDLERVSEARVPLAGHEECRLVLFRDNRDAAEHVAVLIGSPKPGPVSVRLHSACLTGDLLASLRCDCGDQLRSGVEQLAAVGGGVLLYLAQEGRGIGLANKLRAYELQDTGLDTIEADRHLGFGADERSYGAAASMLRHLGMTRIQLLTNNLDKIEALRSAGIEVVGGQSLIGAVNRHNARYVHAKRERAGHLLPEINLDEIL